MMAEAAEEDRLLIRGGQQLEAGLKSRERQAQTSRPPVGQVPHPKAEVQGEGPSA